MYRSSSVSDNSSGQIISGIGIVGLIFVVCLTSEVLYRSIVQSKNRFQTLIDYTADSQNSTIIIHQDPSVHADAKTIGLSVNERTGIEFSYSFFLFVLPSTFDDTNPNAYKHVFHKGYTFPWPLIGPGVFMNASTNTMRVVMNTYKNPYTHADVTNVPIQKWVHVVLNCINNGLDILVNGNLANRISFDGTLPYQNFQDLVLFSTVRSNILGQGGIPVVMDGDPFCFTGSFNGYVSNLIYARYGLSMIEVLNLMRKGPSNKTSAKMMERPPYLADDWWANQSDT
jgi:hypothetical protein